MIDKRHQKRPEAIEEKLRDVDNEDVRALEEHFDEFTPRNRIELSAIISERITKAGITAKWIQDNIPVSHSVAIRIKAGTWEGFIKDDPKNKKEKRYREIIFKIIMIIAYDQTDARRLLMMAGFCPNRYDSIDAERLKAYIIETILEEESLDSIGIKGIYRDRNGEMNDIILCAIKSERISVSESDFRVPDVEWWLSSYEDDEKVGL